MVNDITAQRKRFENMAKWERTDFDFYMGMLSDIQEIIPAPYEIGSELYDVIKNWNTVSDEKKQHAYEQLIASAKEKVTQMNN